MISATERPEQSVPAVRPQVPEPANRLAVSTRLRAADHGCGAGHPVRRAEPLRQRGQLVDPAGQCTVSRRTSSGNVQRDVAAIIRKITSTTKTLESSERRRFRALGRHGEGSLGPGGGSDPRALKDGLSQLIAGFEPYSRDLRLSAADMTSARAAAGVPDIREMQEAK